MNMKRLFRESGRLVFGVLMLWILMAVFGLVYTYWVSLTGVISSGHQKIIQKIHWWTNTLAEVLSALWGSRKSLDRAG